MCERPLRESVVIEEPDRVLIREPDREVYWFKSSLLYPIAGVGWERHGHAEPMGLRPHVHDEGYEINYIVQGQVAWWVEHAVFEVQRGDLFVTHPGERHGGLDSVLHPCERYYLEFILPADSKPLPGLSRKETKMLVRDFEAIQSHCFPGSQAVKEAFVQLFASHRTPSRYATLAARTAMHALLLGVLRDYAAYTSTQAHLTTKNATKNKVSAPIRQAMAWMEERLAMSYSVEEAASVVTMSVSAFHKRFLREVGFTPAEYRTRRRIHKAKEMLRRDPVSITEVAYVLGFSTSQYFATVFKKYVGLSPRQYRGKFQSRFMTGASDTSESV